MVVVERDVCAVVEVAEPAVDVDVVEAKVVLVVVVDDVVDVVGMTDAAAGGLETFVEVVLGSTVTAGTRIGAALGAGRYLRKSTNTIANAKAKITVDFLIPPVCLVNPGPPTLPDEPLGQWMDMLKYPQFSGFQELWS